MPTYIILGKFTDQGIRNIADSPKREDDAWDDVTMNRSSTP
jgi:uncharacterized protein with GYD domain